MLNGVLGGRVILSDLKPANLSHRIVNRIAPLFRAYPINDAYSRELSPIMIIGCGRSGNTMLRSMLVHSGQVAIPPESYVWPAIARGFSRWRFLSWEIAASRIVGAFEGSDFGLTRSDLDQITSAAIALPASRRSLASVLDVIYRYYCELRNLAGRRWGDKTPLNILDIRMIENIFPSAQYVHIVRDPRAVSLSIMTAAKASPGIREKSIAEAADRWNKSVRNARSLNKRIGANRYIEIRYECLLADPERELRRLCKFLNISYNDVMLSFHEGSTKLGDVTIMPHLQRVGQPLDPARSAAWRNTISYEDRVTVERVTRRYRELAGYE